ncbi:MAG: hypothetical protein U0359_19950 [Byssovorax sp.]
MTALDDEILFGWDPTPGIVSVWADHDGQALVYRREGGAIRCERESFRPFVFACMLDDVAHLDAALAEEGSPGAAAADVHYRVLQGDPGGYRFLLSAPSGAPSRAPSSTGPRSASAAASRASRISPGITARARSSST